MMPANEKPALFQDGISPSDVCQGAVGDCWLLAAIATMCEYPDDLKNLFLTKEYNASGDYEVQLFDAVKGEWVVVQLHNTKVPTMPVSQILCCVIGDGKSLCAHVRY